MCFWILKTFACVYKLRVENIYITVMFCTSGFSVIHIANFPFWSELVKSYCMEKKSCSKQSRRNGNIKG